jgi:hypothetical protein
MTLSQNISVALFLLGLFVWARLLGQPTGRHADFARLSEEQRKAGSSTSTSGSPSASALCSVLGGSD